MGQKLASRLNNLIDDAGGDRADVVARMANAAGIEPSTVNQILNTSIDCPPMDRLEGFARALDVNARSLITVAESDGCSYASETREMRDVIVVGEFSKGYPSVPHFDGIDLDALTEGDEKPMFVTIPVAEVDATSGNKRYYDQNFVESVERQMREKRPTAGRGHISDDQRDTAFPQPAGYWIGAIREGKTLWGKAYVPPGDMREVVRHLKAIGGKLATSVYGLAKQTYDMARDAWAVSEFVLESIDFAPPDRAGVSSLARIPVITAEMKSDKQTEDESSMDKLEIINGLTADDVKHLPKTVVAEIIKADGSQNVISEMRGVLGIDEKVDLLAHVTGLQEKIAKQEKEALQNSIVAEVAKVVLPDAPADDPNVKSMRGIVAELAKALQPKDADAVPQIVKTVMDLESVKTQLAGVVVKEMGPNHRQSVKDPNKSGEGRGESTYFDIPDEEDES